MGRIILPTSFLFFASRPLAVLDQVVDDGWVGEGAGVAELVVFVGGDFAEDAAHDFAASRLW